MTLHTNEKQSVCVQLQLFVGYVAWVRGMATHGQQIMCCLQTRIRHCCQHIGVATADEETGLNNTRCAAHAAALTKHITTQTRTDTHGCSTKPPNPTQIMRSSRGNAEKPPSSRGNAPKPAPTTPNFSRTLLQQSPLCRACVCIREIERICATSIAVTATRIVCVVGWRAWQLRAGNQNRLNKSCAQEILASVSCQHLLLLLRCLLLRCPTRIAR